MGKRGRPRHPDILTPREREVLALIRDGLSNDDIGARLGISVDGVKYHVSQILSKLGVASRQEAADWNEALPPWWQRALAPLAWGWRKASASRLGPLTSRFAIAVCTGALGGLAAFGFVVIYTHHRSEEVMAKPAGVVPTPSNGWPGMMHSFFVDSSHGWVPLGNVLFHTIDGGLTWDRAYEASGDITSVYFLSPQAGWLMVGDRVWKSTDGGSSWDDTGRSAPGQVRFRSVTEGWAADFSGSEKWWTSDGGATWQNIPDPCSRIVGGKTKTASGAPQVKVVTGPSSYIDRENGWFVCSESFQTNTSDGKLFRTTDGGANWDEIASLPTSATRSLRFLDNRHGWLLDERGLHASDDGGRSWALVTRFEVAAGQLPPVDSAVRFVSLTEGFLDYNSSSGPAAVFRTKDAGRTWAQLYAGPPPLSAPEVQICRAADVEATVGGFSGFTMGQLGSVLNFRNLASTPCKLMDLPQIDLLDAEGNVVPIIVHRSSGLHPLEDVVLQPGTGQPQPHVKLERGQAYISLFFPTYGPEGPPCRPSIPSIATIRLSWPSSEGSLLIANNGIEPCGHIDVSWFQPSVGVP